MNVLVTKSAIENFFPEASVTETADEFKIHAENFALPDIIKFSCTYSSIKDGVLKRSGTGITITIKK